jgi:hypothetical protein
MQDKTKNGSIVKEHDILNKKQLGRLEHHLQMSKVKLSVSRNENASLKKKVQEVRRGKLLHLQILSDLVNTVIFYYLCRCNNFVGVILSFLRMFITVKRSQ